MPLTHEQLTDYAHQVLPRLEHASYYDLLGVATTATFTEIRAAFYRIASELHPDRYYTLPNHELKQQLESIYARICEGYRVLTTPDKRSAYERVLAEGKFRLISSERESNAPVNPEDTIKHDDAKKFFRMGMICFAGKDWKGAVLNLNFARSFEPESQIIHQKLSEANAAMGKTGSTLHK